MSGSGVLIPRIRRRWIAPAITILLSAVSLTACSGGRNSFWNDGPKYGPRVISLGQPVPKGGGRYKVGSAYRDNDGRVWAPKEDPNYDRTGIASWYGEDFHGRRTANGEIYDMEALTAAHPTLPIPSYVRVTSLKNGRSLVVRVNDRGPYVDNRLIDLSWAVASLLQIESAGTGPVRVQYLGPAPLDGNDKHERHFLSQQPWAGPRVAYASSPAKALRSAGGWQQYSSNSEYPADGQNSNETQIASGGETVVREKFIRDRLTPMANAAPDQQWPRQNETPPPPQKTASIALMSADVAEGAAPRRAPLPAAKSAAQAQQPPKHAVQQAPKAVARASHIQKPKPVGQQIAQSQEHHAALTQPAMAQTSHIRPPKAAPKPPLFAGAMTTGPAPAPAQQLAVAQNASLNSSAEQSPAVSTQQSKPASIYIEAGVFRERALADKLSAILAEIAPTHVALASSGTEIVHRVKVGPFENAEAAETAATRIRAAGLRSAHIMPARGI